MAAKADGEGRRAGRSGRQCEEYGAALDGEVAEYQSTNAMKLACEKTKDRSGPNSPPIQIPVPLKTLEVVFFILVAAVCFNREPPRRAAVWTGFLSNKPRTRSPKSR